MQNTPWIKTHLYTSSIMFISRNYYKFLESFVWKKWCNNMNTSKGCRKKNRSWPIHIHPCIQYWILEHLPVLLGSESIHSFWNHSNVRWWVRAVRAMQYFFSVQSDPAAYDFIVLYLNYSFSLKLYVCVFVYSCFSS